MSCSVLPEQVMAGDSVVGGPSDALPAANWNRIKLSKELANAVQDDARRKAIDSAKKRAVAQHVDYETFEAMVSVAHLKPIERDEWHRKPNDPRSSPAWKFGANGSVDSNEQAGNSLLASCPKGERLDGPDMAPKNADEFQRRWRSMSESADRLRYIRSIPPEKLLPLFRVEIRPGLLGEIFTALNESWEECTGCSSATGEVSTEKTVSEKLSRDVQMLSLDTCTERRFDTGRTFEELGSDEPAETGGSADTVTPETTWADGRIEQEIEETIEMLGVLSKSGRFALTLRLLSGAHKQAMRAFWEKLQVVVQQRAVHGSDRFDEVRKAFNG